MRLLSGFVGMYTFRWESVSCVSKEIGCSIWKFGTNTKFPGSKMTVTHEVSLHRERYGHIHR